MFLSPCVSNILKTQLHSATPWISLSNKILFHEYTFVLLWHGKVFVFFLHVNDDWVLLTNNWSRSACAMARRRWQSGIIILDSCNTSIWNTEPTSVPSPPLLINLAPITAPVITFHYLPPRRKACFPSLEHHFKQLETGIFIGCSLAPHSHSAGCPTCSAVVNISQQAGAMKNVIELSIGQGVGQQGTTSIWLHTWINEETLSGGHCDQA